jgi:hypothetical protein
MMDAEGGSQESGRSMADEGARVNAQWSPGSPIAAGRERTKIFNSDDITNKIKQGSILQNKADKPFGISEFFLKMRIIDTKTTILQTKAVIPFGINVFPLKARRAPQIRRNREANATAAAFWSHGVRVHECSARPKPCGVMDCARASSGKRPSVRTFRPQPMDTMTYGHIPVVKLPIFTTT